MKDFPIKTPKRHQFAPFFSVSIVDFEQVNVSWDHALQLHIDLHQVKFLFGYAGLCFVFVSIVWSYQILFFQRSKSVKRRNEERFRICCHASGTLRFWWYKRSKEWCQFLCSFNVAISCNLQISRKRFFGQVLFLLFYSRVSIRFQEKLISCKLFCRTFSENTTK